MEEKVKKAKHLNTGSLIYRLSMTFKMHNVQHLSSNINSLLESIMS